MRFLAALARFNQYRVADDTFGFENEKTLFMSSPLNSATDNSAAERLIAWFGQEHLPLWLDQGIDTTTGGCFGGLKGNGEPDCLADRFVGDNAHLAWVLCVSSSRHWIEPCIAQIDALHTFAGRHGTRACRSDGYVTRLSPDLKILDETLRLADHAAFMRSSVAADVYPELAVGRAFGTGHDFRRAMNIYDWLKYWLKCQSGAGYLPAYLSRLPATAQDSLASASQLRMLEVFLELYQATGKVRWLSEASTLIEMFRTRFYDKQTGTVKRTISSDLQLTQNSVPDTLNQIGWALALLEHEQICWGRPGFSLTMLQHILKQERLFAGVLPVDDVSAQNATYSLAPLCDLIALLCKLLPFRKAELPDLDGLLKTAMELLFKRFIGVGHPGLCAAQIDADGTPIPSVFTAESTFHLCRAVLNVEDWLKRTRPAKDE